MPLTKQFTPPKASFCLSLTVTLLERTDLLADRLLFCSKDSFTKESYIVSYHLHVNDND